MYELIYCERALFGNYFQPLNTLSNLLFFASALFLYDFYRKNKIRGLKATLMIVLIVFIGLGSSIMHINKSHLTFIIDIVPTLIFFMVYTYFLIQDMSKQKKVERIVGTLWVALVVLASLTSIYLLKNGVLVRGAQTHIVALISFIVVILYARHLKLKHTMKELDASYFLLAIALIFRQIDLLVCPQFQWGTHFLWHIFAAFATYYAGVSVYIKEIDFRKQKK